jgi:hypothetical protein
MGKLNIFFTETIVLIEPKLYIDIIGWFLTKKLIICPSEIQEGCHYRTNFTLDHMRNIYHFSFSKFTIIFTFLQNECLLLSPKIQEGRHRSH